MESPQRPGRPKQRHRPEQKVHDFSGRSRARRESRGNPWRFCPDCGRRFDLGNARRDPKEDFRLAHWLLGESGTNGWSYDTMLIIMNLVIVTTGGGDLSLEKWLE